MKLLFFKKLRTSLPVTLWKVGMFMMLWLMVSGLNAQTEITTTGLSDGQVGVPYTQELAATPAPGADNIVWTVGGLPSGLSLSSNFGTTVTITGVPTEDGAFRSITITASSINGTDTVNPIGTDDTRSSSDGDAWVIIVTEPAGPVSVMMLLDQSGSMDGNISGLDIMGQGTQIMDNSKWSALKVVCNDFLLEWKNTTNPDDQVGIHFFSDALQEFGGGGLQDLSSLPVSVDLNTAVSGSLLASMGAAANQPDGLTCIGGAILTGFNEFPNDVEKGNIIIFTDGMQNTNPSVNVSEPDTNILNLPSVFYTGSGFDPLPSTGNLDLTSLDPDVKIHTIHLGDNAAASIMNAVSVATGGKHFSITNLNGNNANAKFNEFLLSWDQTLVAALRGNSPKLGAVLFNNMAANDPQLHEFEVDNLAEFILFKVIKYNAADSMSVEIRKDGEVIRALSQTDFIDYYRITQDELQAGGRDIGGTWTVNVRTLSSPTDYGITLIIEEEAFDFNTSIGNQVYEPGDTIPLSAELFLFGDSTSRLIRDADSVYVIAAKPGEDFNTLFSETYFNLYDHVTDNPECKDLCDATPGDIKFKTLLEDPAFLAKLQLENRFILLNNEGNGRYSSEFTDTELSGFYRFRFYIRGTHPVLGTYHRVEESATVIDFGPPSTSNSTITGTVVTASAATTNQPQGTYITYTPRNNLNYLLGPNRLGQIDILLGGQRVKLRDNLDGSYTGYISTQATPSTSIDINVKGASTLSVSAREIEGMPGAAIDPEPDPNPGPGPAFELPFGLGATFPIGTFSDNLENGILIELHGEYRIPKSQNLSINFEVGAYNFGRTAPVGQDSTLSMLGVAAGPRLSFILNDRAKVFVDANIGAYWPEAQGANFGFNVGVGVPIKVGDFLYVVPEASYYQVSANTPITFFGAGLGLQARLN